MMPEGAMLIIPLLYVAVVLAVIAIVVIALWRTMRAQEATSHALEKIAEVLSERPRPPL